MTRDLERVGERHEHRGETRGERPDDVADGDRDGVEARDVSFVFAARAREQDGFAAHPDSDRTGAVDEADGGKRRERPEQREHADRHGVAEERRGERGFRGEALDEPAERQRIADEPGREPSRELADREVPEPALVEVNGEHRNGKTVGDAEREGRRVDAVDVGVAYAFTDFSHHRHRRFRAEDRRTSTVPLETRRPSEPATREGGRSFEVTFEHLG